MNEVRTMRAVRLLGHGGLEKLEFCDDVPVPVPGPGEALIQVLACGMNNTDVNTRMGWYSDEVDSGVDEYERRPDKPSRSIDGSWGGVGLEFPRIQGADICGVVEEVAGDSRSTLIGKRVLIDPWLLDAECPADLSRARYLGSETDGGYAEFAVVPIDNVHPISSRHSDAELATFACSWGTAENMLVKARLREDETVVISGASGGVGSSAIQLARMRGARIIAVSSLDKADALHELGVDHVVSREKGDPAEAIRNLAQGGVDVVADTVGGPLFGKLVECLGRGGRYVSCGCIAGPMVSLDLRKLVYRDLEFFGATVVPSGTFARLVEHIEQERIRPLLAEVHPLHDLKRAQRRFMEKRHIGNFVVSIGES
ncbi:MAG: zinc-binding dehydrogenase [Gammaproteobacteria bacterium]|nr:zinc-binding dehydrogenase [Gammaproteobacteria bacterium]MYD76129.1 zinc-binding dehydrogenase [Gammaproteobacteria bacterium]MYJ53222.1 zinc-binding dehydrogenase [Gammaproteobacteria bacterium]